MGSKGVFGSVAMTALERTKAPVLVIPPSYSFRPLEHIVLTVDGRKTSSKVLSSLQNLALMFGAKVTAININTGSEKYAYKRTDIHFDGVETAYREVPMSKSINDSINSFIGKDGCDLLCMIRREKGFIESIFNKSITKAQVFNSHVPLLVLPENSEIFGN